MASVIDFREVLMKARKSEERARDASELPQYKPRKKRAVTGPRERPASAFLGELRGPWDKYLEDWEIGQAECLRWLIAYAIRHNLNPWSNE